VKVFVYDVPAAVGVTVNEMSPVVVTRSNLRVGVATAAQSRETEKAPVPLEETVKAKSTG